MKNNKSKHPDSTDNLLHSPRQAEVAPGKPCTDRASRVNAAFKITQTPNEGQSLEPLESIDRISGNVTWRPADHRNQLDAPKKRTKLRNHD